MTEAEHAVPITRQEGNTMAKATLKEVREFFEANGARKISMQELKELKNSGGYDDIAEGIGNGTLTY